jgi:hypothetical protein
MISADSGIPTAASTLNVVYVAVSRDTNTRSANITHFETPLIFRLSKYILAA